MKITKIKIKNLFGISETELDGSPIELTGTNGAGKTSVIDAIRYALTNNSDREYIVKKGDAEGEIFIETDTGLTINRKKRLNKTDYKSVKENNKEVSSPESFLQTIFTPLQINPIEFTQMTAQEQNRVILDLIEFDWDLNWIKEQFGEIPEGVNYQQNILQVLNDIQAEKGFYFQTRQDVNRDTRNKIAFIEDIAKTIPTGYQYDKWIAYPLGEKYKELEKARNTNNIIQRAKDFIKNYDNQVRGFKAEYEIGLSATEKTIAVEREGLTNTIERLKAEIKSAEDKLLGLNDKLEDKKKVLQAEYDSKVAELKGKNDTALQYAEKEPIDLTELSEEVNTAEKMIKHVNEYKRMVDMQETIKVLKDHSEELTRKIELARSLPAEILKTAKLPVDGLTVENGTPLINGLPVSNLSEGEQLDLCINIAISRPNSLQIILIDGMEKFSTINKERIYAKCKEKGLQFIATRTTDDDELTVARI